jgi:hypothetical protein
MRPMSKWLKQLLFGIWGLLLIPLIAPILEKWLEENVFSNSSGITATAFSNTMAAAAFSSLLALGHQHWFKFAFVFLTGIIIGVSIEWVEPEVGRKKSFRTPKPRLQISQSFRQYPSSDRVVRMAGQCTRS